MGGCHLPLPRTGPRHPHFAAARVAGEPRSVAEAALLLAGPTPLSLADSPTPSGAFNSSLLAHPLGFWVTPTCARGPPNPLREAKLYTPILQPPVVRGS